MEKQTISNTNEKNEELNTEQKILEDAESIILTTTKEIKHEKLKKCFLFVFLPILILLILMLHVLLLKQIRIRQLVLKFFYT